MMAHEQLQTMETMTAHEQLHTLMSNVLTSANTSLADADSQIHDLNC